MRVYYSQLLEPGLRRIFKFVRCLPCDGGMCTGWDMPCEWLNDDVKSHVKGATISRSRVEKFCERYNFWRVVLNGLKRLLYSERAARKQYMKDMDKDVKLIKEWLNEEIGSDWSEVTLGSCESQLGIDARYTKPWVVERDVAAGDRGPYAGREDTVSFVKRTIQRMAPWHKWA